MGAEHKKKWKEQVRKYQKETIILLADTGHNYQLGNQTPLHSTDKCGPQTTFLDTLI